MTEASVTERARYLARRLSGWANQMVCRFGEGTHVYLVGSTLAKSNPRDLDIRIVVPDNLFWRRYRDAADVDRLRSMVKAKLAPPATLEDQVESARREQAVEDWNQWGEWTPDMLRFGREWAKITRAFFEAWSHLGQAGGGWIVDLQILPASEQEKRHKDQPRLQIDTIHPEASP